LLHDHSPSALANAEATRFIRDAGIAQIPTLIPPESGTRNTFSSAHDSQAATGSLHSMNAK
jgi:hypothetical protein